METLARINRSKIRMYYYAGSLLSIILFALFAFSLSLTNIEKEYASNIERIQASITNEKKNFLKNAVNRTIYMIDAIRAEVARENSSRELGKDEIEKISVGKIRKLIGNLRLQPHDGYVWVNKVLNYSGGKGYAVRLIHPNMPETEGMLLSTDMTDVKGNLPYQIELDGINDRGELFFEYYFKKIDSDVVSRKMSYAKLYGPYNWIVASGIHLDELDKLVSVAMEEMTTEYNNVINQSIISTSIAVTIFLAIVFLFERLIRKMIVKYENQLLGHVNKQEELIESLQEALDEVKTLKGIIPICSYCHKIRDDEGAWDQMENYISKHSEAKFSHGICPKCLTKARKEIKEAKGSD